MADDSRKDDTSSGFDDWLAEDPSPPTDPYAALSEEPKEQDLDEWQSFVDTDPGPDDELAEPEADIDAPDVVAEETTGEVPVADASDDPFRPPIEEQDPSDQVVIQEAIVVDASPDDAEVAVSETPDLVADDMFDGDDTGEIPIIAAVDDVIDGEKTDLTPDVAEPVVEFEAFDGGLEPDTIETQIIAPEPFDAGAEDVLGSFEQEEPPAADDDVGDDSVVPFSFPDAPTASEFDPFEDTGEAVFVAGAPVDDAPEPAAAAPSFTDLWGDIDADPGSVSTGGGQEIGDDDFGLDEDVMRRGTTREHTGLAAAIAAAESEDTEQVALVAEIPGLESSVVGFDDVVEAEGHRKARARASGDLIARVVTGVVLVLALGASLVWRPALVALAVAVFVLGAGEFYTALVRSGRKPISLFGFVGIIGASLGAYLWSAAAIPIAFVLASVLLLLFYAVVPGRADPLGNLALTTTVMLWAGLGSFALLIARSDDYQILVLGVVVAVAAADIAAFFVGRSLGRTPLAPWVSPKKTVEGLVAGTIVAIAVGAGLEYFDPFELTSGLAVGAAAAVLTPLGDLAMSAAKRSLGIKDMGSVLPGHGGFLDRIDGLLFTIPVAWAIMVWAGLL